TAVFAAGAADVRHVLVGGRVIVRDGRHVTLPETGRALAEAVAAVQDGGRAAAR
ncbi:formimidoylglutamate deiminase, partial [Streptomyces sp. SID8455]|nr:formimidoylglutamate deiminase [Streptomyces sp. SID8455]